MGSESVDEDGVLWQSLAERLYYVIKDNMPFTFFMLLSEKNTLEIENVINHNILIEGGQRCTSLIVAARYGHGKIVRIILDKLNPDLELEGTMNFKGDTIEGASALWCAAGAGHLTVVKMLVKAGADVNHSTRSGSTPLRAACYEGRLDIVKYLTIHGADVNNANEYNNTCLMIATYKGHADIVSYLIAIGADLEKKAYCGGTALHFAAVGGHTRIVLKLLNRGARMTKNESGMTPLIAAADRKKAEVVEYITARADVTVEEVIEAYELLGASYANDKNHICLSWVYKYLYKAMKLRYKDPNNIIKKKLGDTIKAYGHWRECETLEKLRSIRFDQDAIHMESLAIRERILGPHNPEVWQTVIFRGAVFADLARFDGCTDLWFHALNLKLTNNICIIKDLLRFAQVFSQMIHLGFELYFPQVLSVLEAGITEINRQKSKINCPSSEPYLEQYIEEMESVIKTALYILTIITKLLALNANRYEEKDVIRAHQLVVKLCATQVRYRDGQTFLHLAVNSQTPVDGFHTKDVCKFPCAETAKLLIRCGADVNAMDNERNTPLHIIVGYSRPISDFMTLHTIITELIEAGAHMDTVNSSGKTPQDAVTTGVAWMILRTQTKLSLQCMAAKVVKIHNLPYYGHVPRSLENFIELHGPGLKQG